MDNIQLTTGMEPGNNIEAREKVMEKEPTRLNVRTSRKPNSTQTQRPEKVTYQPQKQGKRYQMNALKNSSSPLIPTTDISHDIIFALIDLIWPRFLSIEPFIFRADSFCSKRYFELTKTRTSLHYVEMWMNIETIRDLFDTSTYEESTEISHILLDSWRIKLNHDFPGISFEIIMECDDDIEEILMTIYKKENELKPVENLNEEPKSIEKTPPKNLPDFELWCETWHGDNPQNAPLSEYVYFMLTVEKIPFSFLQDIIKFIWPKELKPHTNKEEGHKKDSHIIENLDQLFPHASKEQRVRIASEVAEIWNTRIQSGPEKTTGRFHHHELNSQTTIAFTNQE